GFRFTTAFSGLQYPTAMAFSPDGRVFVAEQSGLIDVYDSATSSTPKVFADLRKQVYDYSDHGLLGLALDPQFPTRPYVYAAFSRDSNTRGGPVPKWNDKCPDTTAGCVTWSRVVRLTATGDAATATKVLVDDWCNQFDHSIDGLSFGADGMLYAASGDGGTYAQADYGQLGAPANACGDPPAAAGTPLSLPTTQGGSLRAQSARTNRGSDSLDGALIRIDPNTGAGAAGNPYAKSADPNKRRIVAYGLRNPFRFAFRPGTNDLWIGDAGWNTYEEIDRIPNTTATAARNFGWPCYEGPRPEPDWQALGTNLCNSLYAAHDAVSPYFDYADNGNVVAGDGCAADPNYGTVISGLDFYRGSSYPKAMKGALFFVDFGRSCLYAAPPTAAGVPNFAKRTVVTHLPAVGITDVENGPNDDLYFVNNTNGTIERLTYG
ncbi:MAG TPA: PQQ-dependent sugar dehydrogenase, partial [Acidimicrobiia bacterium]